MEGLFEEIGKGSVDEVKRLLAANPLLARQRDDSSGYTALHFAASKGQTAVAKLLLERGADVAATTLGGKTFRDLAKQKGFEAVAALAAPAAAVAAAAAAAAPPASPARSASAGVPPPSPSPVSDMLACDICGSSENLSRCTRCKSRFYCSVEHQRQDWLEGGHKHLCGASNTTVVLAKRPASATGTLDKTCFELRSGVPLPRGGEVLVRNLFLSLDPYMRARMHDGPSYAAPQPVGQPMQGETVGLVVSSSAPGVKVGTHVRVCNGGWQKYVSCKASDVEELSAGVPLSAHLSALGMPAVTAWHMVNRILKPVKGEVVLISAASGAVGMATVQLARQRGATVIGLAGTDDKCKRIAVLCSHTLCYAQFGKDAAKLAARLRELAPEGVHCYADMVGGWILNAALAAAATHGRVAICGRIAAWEGGAAITDPSLILTRQLTLQGFIVPRDAFVAGRPELTRMLENKTLQYEETVVEGIEAAVEAFALLFEAGSKHVGKLLVKL